MPHRRRRAGQGRDWRLRIEDILEAIARIGRYTAQMSFDDFSANDMVVDAVIRNFAVIGEAAGHVPSEVARRHATVPWELMRRMRNVVMHEYFGVDVAILWSTARDDLPPLVPMLQDILADPDVDSSSSPS